MRILRNFQTKFMEIPFKETIFIEISLSILFFSRTAFKYNSWTIRVTLLTNNNVFYLNHHIKLGDTQIISVQNFLDQKKHFFIMIRQKDKVTCQWLDMLDQSISNPHGESIEFSKTTLTLCFWTNTEICTPWWKKKRKDVDFDLCVIKIISYIFYTWGFF